MRMFKMKDQEGVKVEDSPSKSPSSESSTSAQWKKERQADADEQWFNDDDTEVVVLFARCFASAMI